MNWLNKKDSDSSLDMPGGKVDTNFGAPLRWGLAVLLLGFGGFAAWAAFAPLDAGVPANATVQVFGNRKSVQHLEGGTVEEILVREGDQVKAGQILIRLNDTRAVAEQGVISSQYILAKTTEARLLAERDGLPKIQYDPAVAERFQNDPRYISATSTQDMLFTTRREALEGEIAILQENLHGAEQQLKGLAQVQANRKNQISFIQRELKGVRELAKEGYLPRNRMFELERDAAQLQAALSNDVVEAGRTRNQVAELKLRILQRRQDYQKEVQSQLSEVQKEASALGDRLASLDYTVRETKIRAPIDGYVQNLSVHTVGGVIRPGTEVMEVVPLDHTYIVQAQVPVQAIDKVHPDLDVEITFPAFNHAQTPNIPGKVLTVSADRLVDQATHMPYYLAQVKVTPKGMEMLAGNAIRPGMPASVLIRTGERTMLSYLLKPFLERLDKSFKEQ
ncbi:HlyD family type I secretion periplasmic adaptor subunit [Parapusillimonas granuli]|uniref:Membrane fusion protein (MFP) family protein n=1 Tax=Parapusillimonas granuli TaxID=380911 RepID=A0A853G1T6_9BURK|nr:HlyD family type I secretion periplasmic adaptor subunit [Parapusillimonas granuli]MBB5215501.1 protease secretion system membrane fusion protein [Parapusillimonas granuli]MEB2400338.1 HlyD family type I secretion periplasmic adaptor subunit [Alcaligenaceae bacterium]NYT49832.1 HlyD family type I secretion periplasmic adaptor subunit [Parapusillimonas granuli]